MKFLKRFRPCSPSESWDGFIEEMYSVKEGMLRILDGLASGEIPNEEYSLYALKEFVRSLIVAQEDAGDWWSGPPDAGYWCLGPIDLILSGESDVRVDFLYEPTYIAVAILTRVLLDHRVVALRFPEYEYVLGKGMRFATGRGLWGHGFDAEWGQFHAVEVLWKGRVPEFLSANPDFCPEMYGLLVEIRRRYSAKIAGYSSLLSRGITKFTGDWYQVCDTREVLERYKKFRSMLDPLKHAWAASRRPRPHEPPRSPTPRRHSPR